MLGARKVRLTAVLERETLTHLINLKELTTMLWKFFEEIFFNSFY